MFLYNNCYKTFKYLILFAKIMTKTLAIVGMQFGDEGKGKIEQLLLFNQEDSRATVGSLHQKAEDALPGFADGVGLEAGDASKIVVCLGHRERSERGLPSKVHCTGHPSPCQARKRRASSFSSDSWATILRYRL